LRAAVNKAENRWRIPAEGRGFPTFAISADEFSKKGTALAAAPSVVWLSVSTFPPGTTTATREIEIEINHLYLLRRIESGWERMV
jgi:hypothetical protein